MLFLWWFASTTVSHAFDVSWLPWSGHLYDSAFWGLLEAALVGCGLWAGVAAINRARQSGSGLRLSTQLESSPLARAAIFGAGALAMSAWFVQFRLRVWLGGLDPADVDEEVVRLLSSTTQSGIPAAAFLTLSGLLTLSVASLLPAPNAPRWSVERPYRVAATLGGFLGVAAAFTLCTGGL